jgi:4-nitrophenyl phosphatase
MASSTDPLSQYDAFLVDIDGVLVRGDRPVEGAAEGLRALQDRGRILLLTNNSSRSRDALSAHLRSLGFAVDPADVLPSSRVVADYLAHDFGAVSYWALGEAGLEAELRAAGHRPTTSPEDADWLIAGIDRGLSYEKLALALRALLSGARLLGTNDDATFPGADGLLPGAGSILGALAGMGFPPETVIGKPSLVAFDAALRHLDVDRSLVLMIGDRLETDIAGAAAAGLDSALVLTGISRREDLVGSNLQPTWIAETLLALTRGAVERPPA